MESGVPADQGRTELSDRVEELLDGYLDLRLGSAGVEIETFLAGHPELEAGEHERLRRLAVLLGSPGEVWRDSARASPGRDRVGPYRVVRELGRGGQSTVFLAEDTRFTRKVALKVLARHGLELGDDAQERESSARLRREAEVLSRLDHPGICVVYEMGEEHGERYIAMRHVEGETLARKIAAAREEAGRSPPRSQLRVALPTAGEHALDPATPPSSGRRSVDQVLALVECCARALHVAHEAGVVHRDVKPGNVMVTPDGQPVLLDFGLARDLEQEATLTAPNGLLGTPAYMAPEQLSSARANVDRRVDVYALGVTLYECLTLERPFQTPTRELLYKSILTEAPPAARNLNPSIPRDLEVVLETALEKEPDRRYQTALDLAEDLRRVRVQEPIRARPAGMAVHATRWIQRNPVLSVTLGGLLLALASGLAVTLYLLGRAQDARRWAEEQRLISDSRAVLATNPCLALLLAIEGAGDAPDRNANEALLAAIGPLRELRMLDTPEQMQFFLPSPDGRFFVTAAHDGAPRVWDAVTWEPVADLGGHGEISGLAFRGDSGLLATSAGDGTCRLWSTADWSLVHAWKAPFREVTLVGFVDGGQLLVTSNSPEPGQGLQLWDVERESPLTIDTEGMPVERIRVSSGGDRLLLVHPRAGLQVWEAGNRAPRQVFARANTVPDGRLSAIFSPDGQWVLAAWDRGGALWEARTGERLCALDSEWPGVGTLAFGADGTRMLVGRADGRAEIRAAPDGRILCELTGVQGDAVFSPDGALIVDGAGYGAARLWNAETGEELGTLTGHESSIHAPHFSRSGRTVITAATDGTVREWNLESESQRRTIPAPPCSGSAVPCALGGGRIACATDLGVSVIDLDSPAANLDLELEPANFRCLELSADGSSLLVVAHPTDSPRSCTVRSLDAGSGAPLVAFAHPSGTQAYDARFSPDGRAVVTACNDHKARIWNAQSGELERELSGHTAGVRSAAFGPDGQRIITAAESLDDPTVRIWDARSGAMLAVLGTGGERPIQARLSPDGRQAVAGCWWGMVCLWDVASQELYRWQAHSHQLLSVAFSSDGKHILTAAADGVRLWSTETLDEVMKVEPYEALNGRGAAFTDDGRWIVAAASDAIRLWPVDPLGRARELSPRSLTAAERERYGLAGREEP